MMSKNQWPKDVRDAFELVVPYYVKSKSDEEFYKNSPREVIEAYEKAKKWAWDQGQSL